MLWQRALRSSTKAITGSDVVGSTTQVAVPSTAHVVAPSTTDGVVRCTVLAIIALLTPAGSDAAIVRDVGAFPAATETRIVIEVGGDFRYRIHPSDDGTSVLADIEDATVEDGVARMLPISDARVDGVIVLADEAARIVRISIDVAGRIAPRLDAHAADSKLVLTFADPVPGSFGDVETQVASASPRAGDLLRGKPALSHAERVTPAAAGSVSHVRSDAASSGARVLSASRSGATSMRSVAAPTVVASSAIAHDSAQVGPASAGPAARAELVRSVRSRLEKPVVVLDPGHGGKDPGAKAWTGEYEKDIVLDVAERVARRLRSKGDVDVVMTRTGDEYVELVDRRDTSRKWNAAVFVSIHANASQSSSARGFETYYRTRSTASPKGWSADRLVRRLARLENAGSEARSRKSGVSRASLTSDQMLPDHGAESQRLAQLVQSELVRQLDLRYEAVRDLGAREGPFFVIGNNAAPSVLVEAAFLTHREEGLRMRSEVYREQIADGVARGIRLFLDEQQRAGEL